MLYQDIQIDNWFYYKGYYPRTASVSELYLVHILEKEEHGLSGDLCYFCQFDRTVEPIYITSEEWNYSYNLETPLNKVGILKLLLGANYDYKDRKLFYSLNE
jgi:hypothetical protein